MLTGSERKLKAIMFTDIEGYTALTQRDEAAALKLLETFRSLVRPILTKYGGHEIKTMGDGALIDFGSALEASQCAVEIQKALHEFNETAPVRILARIGIHVGDVVHAGGDVFGDAVNIASRIEPLAPGGGVCISGQVYYQVRNKLPYGMIRLESSQLKNVEYPTDVYRLEMPWEMAGSGQGRKSDKRRLAVLPLDNISPDANDEYFADGLTDELITALSHVKGLEVIARTSVLRYKGGAKQIVTIGDELHVGSVLEGSVRKAGNRIRVTAQLIDASNQAHIWSDSYDRQLDDVFAVQSDIAGKVAEALRLELSTPDVPRRPTPNLEAYTLCLKGRFVSSRLNKEAILKGIALYERALALAPDFAACYADLASAWLILGFFELMPSADASRKSKEYASKALELDESLPEAHVVMGRILRMYEWKFIKADRELKRATELDPNLARAHAFRAQGLVALGKNDEAIAEARRALELDPFSATTCQILGTLYLYDKLYDEAIELYERALEIEPDSPFPLGNLGLAHIQKGEVLKGIAMLERANQLEGSNPSSKDDLAYAYGKAGRTEDVKKILAELLEMHKESQRAAPAIAGVYTTLGDFDKAFNWLKQAYEQHTPYFVSTWQDFIFDPLRTDPRYKELVDMVGIEEG